MSKTQELLSNAALEIKADIIQEREQREANQAKILKLFEVATTRITPV